MMCKFCSRVVEYNKNNIETPEDTPRVSRDTSGDNIGTLGDNTPRVSRETSRDNIGTSRDNIGTLKDNTPGVSREASKDNMRIFRINVGTPRGNKEKRISNMLNRSISNTIINNSINSSISGSINTTIGGSINTMVNREFFCLCDIISHRHCWLNNNFHRNQCDKCQTSLRKKKLEIAHELNPEFSTITVYLVGHPPTEFIFTSNSTLRTLTQEISQYFMIPLSKLDLIFLGKSLKNIDELSSQYFESGDGVYVMNHMLN